MPDSGTEIWRLATALSGAVTPLDVAVALAEEGAAAAGASFSNMAVHGDGRTWVIHGAALEPAAAERWAQLDDRLPTPLSAAIHDAVPVLLADVDAIGTQYPALVEDTLAAGLAATASVPLLTSEGVAAGAAGFGWPAPQAFDPDQLRPLDLIARMAASALERAVLYQRSIEAGKARELEDAQLLQDVFLPRQLPRVEQLETAAVYLPAADAPMGGDWYDVFDIDGGTCFVIGDVVGHDLRAAAIMAQLRNAVRAYAVEHSSPGRVVTELNRMLCRLEPSETASAIVVTWDPERAVVVRADAGHPPILRCGAGGTEYLDAGSGGPILGADAAWVYADEVEQLHPGSTLLFYTDGLIEQRDEDLTEGMAALRDVVARLDDLSPQALCDAVLRWRLGYGRREDDICLLAVRLT